MAHATEHRLRHWRSPTGWVETKAGIFVPPGYVPSAYELDPPAIDTKAIMVRERERCRQRIAYFAFYYCWTIDIDAPNLPPVWRRFPAYKYLTTFFDSVTEPSNTHTDKSRQMSLSWGWMIVFLHDLIFREEWPTLVISRRAKEVDDGGEFSTKDSLLGKLRVIWTRLPAFLAPSLDIKRYLITNPDQQNHVKGETGNLDAGRGSTYKRALMDEAGHTKHGETVFSAVSSAAKTGTNLNGTPNGKDNVFYRIRHLQDTTFRKLRFHWTEHPRYAAGLYCACKTWQAQPRVGLTAIQQFHAHVPVCPLQNQPVPQPAKPRSPYYDKYERDHTPEQTAREMDISYEGSKAGRIMTTFHADRHTYNHHLIEAIGPRRDAESFEDYRRRYLQNILDPNLPLVVGWDFGSGALTCMSIGQEVDSARQFIRWIDCYYNNDQSYDHYGTIWNTFYLPIWREVGGMFDPLHYGDPSGINRDSKLESWIGNLALMEIRVNYNESAYGIVEWLDYLKALQRRGDYQIVQFASFLIDANEQYSWPIDREGNRIPGKHKPVHNVWSHPMDSHRYVYMFHYGDGVITTREEGWNPADDGLAVGMVGPSGGTDSHAQF